MRVKMQVGRRRLRLQQLVRRKLMRRRWCLRTHRMLVTRLLKLRRRAGHLLRKLRRRLRGLRVRLCWLLVDLLRKRQRLLLTLQRLLERQLTKLLKRLARRLVQRCWMRVVAKKRQRLLRWQRCKHKEGLLKHRRVLLGQQWLREVGHRRRLGLLLRKPQRLVVRVRLMRRRLLVWRLVLLWRRVEGQLLMLQRQQEVQPSKQEHPKMRRLRLLVRLLVLL